MRELDVIDRLRAAFPDWGIGDDAAVLPPARGEMLFAADAAVEAVHFDRRLCTLSQAVQKLVTSNVSDIFAMGGSPLSIAFTAALPPGCSFADVDSIIEGLRRSTKRYGITLAGGDTVSSPHGYCFNVAIVGEAPRGRAVLRSGARAGDALVLFGEIGLSRAGLNLLTRSLERPVPDTPEAARCIQRHLAPVAVPLDPSLLVADPPLVTAMIDVSDGLAKDLRTLCEESGVGAAIREDALPVPPAVGGLCGLEGEALVDFALSSGEEYVLLAAVSPEGLARLSAGAGAAGGGPAGAATPGPSTVIGVTVPASEGIALVDRNGKRRPLPKLGYEHEF